MKIKFSNSSVSNYREYIVGVDTKIFLPDGKYVTAVNFDNAASTPPLISVMQQLNEFAPWYSSVHRGTGYKSQVSSDAYDHARKTVAGFVNVDLNKNCVIFVKNTTEAINKLSYRLLDNSNKDVVLSSFMEHHSNDLPWRGKYKVDYILVDQHGKLRLDDLEVKLKKYNGRVKLVTITGASNVTGYCNCIHKIAALAHKYDAKILVDGAQLVPHVPINMNPENRQECIDFLAFSAHKMYAPFGTGVLIGPTEVFEKGIPEYVGGGTVDTVTHEQVTWAPPPNKEEAGSPNVMGVIALSQAIQTLSKLNMKTLEHNEKNLTDYALKKINKIDDIQLYGNAKDSKDRLGIIPFNIKGFYHGTVAEILSQESGIAVRNGCFCAQPYVRELLNTSNYEAEKYIYNNETLKPGMVRVSLGLYNTHNEIDILVNTLKDIVNNKDKYLKKYKGVFPTSKSFA